MFPRLLSYEQALVDAACVARLKVPDSNTLEAITGAKRFVKSENGFVEDARMPEYIDALIRYLKEADQNIEISFRNPAPTSTKGAIAALDALLAEVS